MAGKEVVRWVGGRLLTEGLGCLLVKEKVTVDRLCLQMIVFSPSEVEDLC